MCSRIFLALLIPYSPLMRGQDLTALPLEDLMNVVVTSVSKKAQPLSKTPAAAFVLTQDDIRRSGMTNLPDLLRLVPGVNVARISANTWATSIRGFNDRYASKVLVMIDGRSVYSPEFSGVFWDQWSVPLEDIERIEVIRGPGGTVWGANAMNGVINIITKSSAQTQGGLVAAGGGSADSAQTHVRYGGAIGGKGTYRIYGRYFNTGHSEYRDRTAANDQWSGGQGGFRSDWILSPNDNLMVEGDFNSTRAGQTVSWNLQTFDETVSSATRNFLARWNHIFANGSEARVQVFHSHIERPERGQRQNDTADGEAQYRFRVGKRHDVVTGLGFRYTGVTLEPEESFRYDQTALVATLANAFVQDEMALGKSWTLTFGSKFERNSFTGFEVEPSGQLLWSPNDQRAAWFSVSRAIRQPSIYEHHSILDYAMTLPGGMNGITQLRGSRDVSVEQLLSLEAGYRTAIGSRFTLDAAVFRSRYRDLLSVETDTPQLVPAPQPYLIVPARFASNAGARNYGGEIMGAWHVTDTWRVTAGYSFLQMKLWPYATSNDPGIPKKAGDTPKHQWQLRSGHKLARNVDWDVHAFYVHSLRSAIRNVPDFIPAYVRLDTRLAWRPLESLEVSVTGQNLLSPRRPEFPSPHLIEATQVQRAVFGKLAWTF